MTSLLGSGKHLYRNNIFNPLIFQSSTTSGIANGKQETVKIIRLLNYNRDMKKVCFFFFAKETDSTNAVYWILVAKYSLITLSNGGLFF